MSPKENPAPRLEFIGIRSRVMKERFDPVDAILGSIKECGEGLFDGDVLIVSSKYLAMAEGRFVKLEGVRPGKKAHRLAKRVGIPAQLAQLVIEDADMVLKGIPGFALTIKDGVFAPNAGIDRSNIFPGFAIRHPLNPSAKAEELRRALYERTEKKVGVVISDSRLMPTRVGTIGIAIGVSGFEPLKDERGRKDLFGNTLRFTQRAIADDLCSAAQLIMGEADEAMPIVIARPKDIKDGGITYTSRPSRPRELAIPFDECLYVRSLLGEERAKRMMVQRKAAWPNR